MDSVTLTKPISIFTSKPSIPFPNSNQNQSKTKLYFPFRRARFVARTHKDPDPSPSPSPPIVETLKEWLWPSNEGERYLLGGGLGVALLSVTATARVKISPVVAQLAANPTFVAGVAAWFVAQSAKVVLGFFVERRWDPGLLFASGGMPSSHSALCTALSTSVALCHGVADSLFPVCLGFSLIVMYDAIGVRRHAGMQAQVHDCDKVESLLFCFV